MMRSVEGELCGNFFRLRFKAYVHPRTHFHLHHACSYGVHVLQLGHDEWSNSEHVTRSFLWSCSVDNIVWRLPFVFGPLVSPRQDHQGRIPHPGLTAKTGTHSARFKKSAKYLKNQFRSLALQFSFPGTVVKASFRCVELKNLT